MSFMSIENSDIYDNPSWSELLTVGLERCLWACVTESSPVLSCPFYQYHSPCLLSYYVLLVLHTGQ